MEKTVVTDSEAGKYPENSPDANRKEESVPAYQKDARKKVQTPLIYIPWGGSERRQPASQESVKVPYEGPDRRVGIDRRSMGDRRTGSRNRRTWQESRWIGAPDCRGEFTDRRRGWDRRKGTDRRRR